MGKYLNSTGLSYLVSKIKSFASNASNLTAGTLPAARLPTATTSALGGVMVDGSTITISNGVISYDLDSDIIDRSTDAPSAIWMDDGGGVVVDGALPVGSGGTGSTSASGARTNLSVYSKSEVDALLDVVGTYYNAAWSATSSSANATQLTAKTSALTAGTYLVEVQYPVLSASTFTAELKGAAESNRYILGGNYTHAMWVVTVNANAQLYLVSAQSSSCTFSYTARGWLRATRLK